MRTFIAIDLDANIKDCLVQLIAKLKTCHCDVRWVKAHGMHLTLKFLGEISPEKISEITKIMDSVCKKHQPFPLRLDGTGTFPPDSKKPRVVWIGVQSSEVILSFQQELEQELVKINFPPEKRRYRPHLTLGRVKSYQGLPPLLKLLENDRKSEFGRMEVNELSLFKSTLKPTGAEYTKVSVSKLV